MSYAAELETIRSLFVSHWTATPVLWSNAPEGPPAPVGDRDAATFPASFVAVEVEYDSQERVTFGGTAEIRGRVVSSVWVELNADEDALRARIDDLRAMFRLYGDAGGFQFLEPMISDKSFPEDDSPWYRAVASPFVRFEDS